MVSGNQSLDEGIGKSLDVIHGQVAVVQLTALDLTQEEIVDKFGILGGVRRNRTACCFDGICKHDDTAFAEVRDFSIVGEVRGLDGLALVIAGCSLELQRFIVPPPRR